MATSIPNIYGVTGSNVIWNIPPGATGPTGPVGSSSGTLTLNTTSNWAAYGETQLENDIVIRRSGKNDIKVAKTLEMLMERLCVIEPAMDLIEKYPALREAYENYKIVEAMVKHGMENEDE